MHMNEQTPAPDDAYFEALGITPTAEDSFEDLRAIFMVARTKGINPDAFREYIEKRNDSKVFFANPEAMATMMRAETFFTSALQNQDATIETDQCNGVTHTPVLKIISNTEVSFEGASLVGLKEALMKMRGMSVSSLNNGGFEIELEVAEEQ